MSNKDSLFEGQISLSTRATGYVKDPNSKEDIEIQEDKLNKALHRDVVLVRDLGEDLNGRKQGEVVEIVSRNKMTFVGTIENTEGKTTIKPDNRKVYIDLILNKEDLNKVKENDKVLVEIVSWEKDTPEIKLVEVIGQKGLHNVEMRAIVLDKGFETGFDQKIEKEAEELKKEWSPVPSEEIEKRLDLREVTTFTIDPKTAKDFDDALSFEKLENGNYKIGIHIADVSHFVKPESLLDKEARERAFSVYLVDRTIPMLPEILSNDLCSLNPDEEKLAFSAMFELTANAEIKNKWFGKTIIKSNKRFSYEDAQEILDKGSGTYSDELKVLHSLAERLRKNKFANGAIIFMKDEFEFELDKDGVPLSIKKKDHLDTHWLIEEFMLLANRNVAKFVFDQDKKLAGDRENDLIFRIHQSPELDKIKELTVFLKALGYNLELEEDGSVTAKSINDLFGKVKGKPEEGLVTSATIKTMSKAIYSTKNSGHFGLAFDFYTHFTSPIRRYPDLIIHRILEKFLKGETISDKEARDFIKIAENSTNQEIAAAEAERDSIKYKQVEFMQNHIGSEFTGVISGVAKWGIYVLLDENGADGMVHISKIGDDFYNFDEKNYRIVGEKTGDKYTLGDRVRVKVDGADLEEKKLDMSFVK